MACFSCGAGETQGLDYCEKCKKTLWPHFWQEPRAPVQFTHRGKVYTGVVVAWTDSSRRENDYDLCKIEVEEHKHYSYTDWNNQRQVKHEVKRYLWPGPVQSYKLRKRGA